MHLLVIDDSQEHLEVLKDIFEPEGYRVTTSENAFHALEILSEEKIHCIITDRRMPHISGDHFIEIVKEKHPAIPVIILSAYVENDKNELIDKGAYAVLSKPPNITFLVASVENAIHKNDEAITFVFSNTNLKNIKNTVISRLVTFALSKCRGNQVKASKLLGISRQSLIRYIQKFELKLS